MEKILNAKALIPTSPTNYLELFSFYKYKKERTYTNLKDRLWIFNSIQNRKTRAKMAHASHVTNDMVIGELTSTRSQCDVVLPVLQIVKVLQVVLTLLKF